jgi:hypothetical protein
MIKRSFIAAACAVAIALAAAPASGAELNVQKSTERGVTVSVTPITLSRNAGTWDFKVVLDTHREELSDDVQRTAVLIAPNGTTYKSTAWKGAPPGGHHREGVLRFAAIEPSPASIELQIQRPTESTPRSFRWQLQ